MKALVDRLSVDLGSRYGHYLETFRIDLWSDAGFIEFRSRFALRRDHLPRSYTVKVEADAGETDGERKLLIVVVFDEIREALDLVIADEKALVN
jgi:hypothetical protein